MPCYQNLLLAHGQSARARAAEQSIEATLTAVDRPLGSARVAAAGMRGGKLEVALVSGGPEHGELRYALSRDGKTASLLGASGSVPPLARWQGGRLYLDRVELPVGRWEVELQIVGENVAGPLQVRASAPLGTFTR